MPHIHTHHDPCAFSARERRMLCMAGGEAPEGNFRDTVNDLEKKLDKNAVFQNDDELVAFVEKVLNRMRQYIDTGGRRNDFWDSKLVQRKLNPGTNYADAAGRFFKSKVNTANARRQSRGASNRLQNSSQRAQGNASAVDSAGFNEAFAPLIQKLNTANTEPTKAAEPAGTAKILDTATLSPAIQDTTKTGEKISTKVDSASVSPRALTPKEETKVAEQTKEIARLFGAVKEHLNAQTLGDAEASVTAISDLRTYAKDIKGYNMQKMEKALAPLEKEAQSQITKGRELKKRLREATTKLRMRAGAEQANADADWKTYKSQDVGRVVGIVTGSNTDFKNQVNQQQQRARTLSEASYRCQSLANMYYGKFSAQIEELQSADRALGANVDYSTFNNAVSGKNVVDSVSDFFEKDIVDALKTTAADHRDETVMFPS